MLIFKKLQIERIFANKFMPFADKAKGPREKFCENSLNKDATAMEGRSEE